VERPADLIGILAAIGIGLLIGVVRERTRRDGAMLIAGVRTHLVVALGGALATLLGWPVLVAFIATLGALVAASYWRTSPRDPGLTSEVTILATALLAATAQQAPALAAGVAVVVAGALFAKQPLHRFAREIVSEQELKDGLLLAAAALIVLPLLPTTPVDPWHALVPARVWRLVVLIMAVGMAGHVALRSVGARWGLAVAGFFAGFASSTAAIAGFGHRARAEPPHAANAAAGALLANVASLGLLAAVIGAASPALLFEARWLLLAYGVVLAGAALLGLLRAAPITGAPEEPPARAFRLSHGLLLGALMATLTLMAAWLRAHYGEAGAVAAAMAVAIVELQAAGASIGQLHASGTLAPDSARAALAGLLTVSSVAKAVIACASGGTGFGLRMSSALALALLAAIAALALLA
jgi:uncharacterized membrane protein (DUF4010 family)